MSEKSPRWANNGEGKSRWILGAVLLLLATGLAVGLGVGYVLYPHSRLS
jgi:hypothetical protein